jgi:lipopolysaccharide transport system ATP-binding protein
MIVRLGFAVAACIEPDVLLVDEVLAVGDASFQQKCLNRIRYLINNGTSIIFVSHNLYLAQAACNIALYLKEGQVKYHGPIKDVFDRYQHDLYLERARKLEGIQTAEILDNSDKVEINRIEVLNGEEVKIPILLSDRPAKIQIHYTAYISLGRVHVSSFLLRSDGVTCCMMRSKLDDFDLSIERGNGFITVQLTPLQVVGGTYCVEAWILDETDSMTITSKAFRSDWFIVKGKALSYNESSVFEPNTQWEHHPFS